MDFKDLLSLAKDNQSFSQKKLLRDQLVKNKQKEKTSVSDTAIQAFLARKQKEQEQLKAAKDAARKKRIEEKLELSQGKGTPLNNNNNAVESSKTSGNVREGKVNSKLEDLRRQNLRHLSRPPPSTKKKRTNEAQESYGNAKEMKRKPKQDLQCNEKMDFKELMKVAKNQADKTPSKPDLSNFKQHRRKKGSSQSNFEWSGSINTMGSKEKKAASLKPEKEQTEMQRQLKSSSKTKMIEKKKKATASSMNFQDLMDAAKQQVSKTSLKMEGKSTKQQVKKEIEKSSKTIPAAETRAKLVDINSMSLKKVSKVIEKPKKKYEQNERPRGCTLVTRTITSQSNYKPIKPNPPSNSLKGDAKKFSERNKLTSIDEELDRERRELERKRNMLKRKMQGNAYQGEELSEISEYSEDDYDDDMADFIDDEGEDMDYSKHIRSIFGYDRRKFHDDDDDVDKMESSYYQIAAEEARSARIAKLEDEIEKRREDMELSRAKKKRR